LNLQPLQVDAIQDLRTSIIALAGNGSLERCFWYAGMLGPSRSKKQDCLVR
jgi:hypothetical protein